MVLSITQKTQQNTEFCCVRMFLEEEGNPNINHNMKNNVKLASGMGKQGSTESFIRAARRAEL